MGRGAEALKRFLPEGWKIKSPSPRALTLVTGEGSAFSLDFDGLKKPSYRQPLAKAVGFKGQPLSVLDISAGWAKDACLLFLLGCEVTAVEIQPLVFYFVQESLKRQKRGLKSPRLKFILDDSLNYMKGLKEKDRPDVIFMDPMFGLGKKSLSQKPLRLLKELSGETKSQKELLAWALRKAKKRAVVKRHRLEAPLRDNPVCCFKGRSVCYDVFAPEKGSAVL